jgi:hypothetical protein
MTAPLPDPILVLAAIDTYLEIAYQGAPPADVTARVDPLRVALPEAFFVPPSFECSGGDGAARFCLRLGNSRYPFMKLTVEPRPDMGGYLFKADTHDRHVCPPPESGEREAFMELMAFNQQLAGSIEEAWEKQALPTFKSWLRADLLRRTRARSSGPPER